MRIAILGFMNVVTSLDRTSEFLTVTEVAERLRCSEPTVRRRIREGQLPAVQLGPGYAIRVRADALEGAAGT